jgi:hypothetical protein
MPPKPKGVKMDSLGLDASERALKKRDPISPSIRQTSILPSVWPSAQGDLDFMNANWKEWACMLHNVICSHRPLSLHLDERPVPSNPDLKPTTRRNWDLNNGVVSAAIMLHISLSKQDFLESK